MGNWFNLVIILVAVGGPVLGRVMQEVEKKRKARQRQKDAQARDLEALRTGRVSADARPGATRTPHTSTKVGRAQPAHPRPTAAPTPTARNATQRMQELAKKRQEQLNELRRRQQAARQRAAGGSSPVHQTSSKPQNRGKSKSTRQRQAEPTTQKPRQALRETPRLAPTAGHSSIHELPISERVIHPATEASQSSPVEILGKRMTPADWRRFIVARELLDPPLALREQHGGLPL